MDPIWFYYFILAVLGTPYGRKDEPYTAPVGVDKVFWRSICNAIKLTWYREGTYDAVPLRRGISDDGKNTPISYFSEEDFAAYLARWHPP